MRLIPRRRILLPTRWRRSVAAQSAFESAVAGWVGTRHALGVSSARRGLAMVLRALSLRPGDEVLCPAYGFSPLVLVIRDCGLVPVFVDADPATFNVDPALLAERLSPRTRALLVTHLFGQPCEMEAILQFTRVRNLILLEDCAHALGATYRGRPVGSFGTAGFFSFGLGKNLPCGGGGMVTTSDDLLARALRQRLAESPPPSVGDLFVGFAKLVGASWLMHPAIFRWLGAPVIRWFGEAAPGIVETAPRSPRLAHLQASLGLAQWPGLAERNRLTARNAQRLREALQDLPEIHFQQPLPETQPTGLYCRVLVPEPRAFRRQMWRLGVDTKADDMSNCGGATYPVAARLAQEGVELPNGPELSEADLQQIIGAVRTVLRRKASPAVSAVSVAPATTLTGQ